MKEICASFNFQILRRNQNLILFLQHQNLPNWLGAHFLDLISILMHSEVIKIIICVMCFLKFLVALRSVKESGLIWLQSSVLTSQLFVLIDTSQTLSECHISQ